MRDLVCDKGGVQYAGYCISHCDSQKRLMMEMKKRGSFPLFGASIFAGAIRNFFNCTWAHLKDELSVYNKYTQDFLLYNKVLPLQDNALAETPVI